MGERLVVIGGVAAGMSAASQAKRRKPDLEVVVLERGEWVSYGACGMPYNIQDPERRIDDLVVISAERFRTERGIDVRTGHEAIELDLGKRTARVRRPGGESELAFDQLVIATGCRPIRPDWPGMDLAGVFVLHSLDHAQAIKRHLADRSLRRAAVVGGGHIGLEMADVLSARGLAVTLFKRSPELPTGYPEEITRTVGQELARYGVDLRVGVEVLGFEGQGRMERVLTEQGPVDADLVLVAIGVRPEVELARQAGIRLGPSGAIAVDDRMQSSAEGVFAAGDCAEAYHRLLGRGVFLPRGTTANKQGRIAGANVAGADERFRGVLGSSVTKIFSLAVGHTGLTIAEAWAEGLEADSVSIEARTRAHAYPGSRSIAVRLVFEPGGGRLLGAQMAGGEGVAKRLDVVAAALTAGFDVDELAGLDMSYAPPFAPVWDPVLVAANQARKKIRR
ncbi:MAG: FAD-dependent oxidoreductase [Deltaproteobacteria bacterium]|nr:FAD-dependent oxidoreductase [Deltaproteobacteria bacterium]